jgi:hypothetical protein
VECERLRRVSAGGMVETLTLRCWTPEPVRLRLSIRMGSDFADIFEVRRLAGDPGVLSPGDALKRAPGDLIFEAAGTRARRRCTSNRHPTS